MYGTAFSPNGPNVSHTTVAATSSAAIAIPGSDGNIVLVYNSGASPAFISFGSSALPAAVVTDIPLSPGIHFLAIDPARMTHFRVFSATASMVIYVMRGGRG